MASDPAVFYLPTPDLSIETLSSSAEGSRLAVSYPAPVASLPDSMMPTKAGRARLPKAVRIEHQRERALKAAIKVFAKRGYPGATVDHLVDAAKIGVGNFYELFGGKESCFLYCYERIVADATEQIDAAIPADADWPKQALEGLRALLEAIEQNPLRARLALVEVQTAGPKALAASEETLASLTPLVARGRRSSPFADALPDRLEEAVLGGLSWFLKQRIVLGELGDFDERLGDAVEIVIEPYVGTKAAAKLLKS